MSNVYIQDELEEMYDKAEANAKERRKRLNYQRNVAAFVDFASNLVSTIARERGKLPTSRIKEFKGAFKVYSSPNRDYKGNILGSMFRARFTPGASRGK